LRVSRTAFDAQGTHIWRVANEQTRAVFCEEWDLCGCGSEVRNLANTSLVAENCGLYSWSAVVALVRTYDRRARLTHTREGRDRKWSRRRWPAFLRERVSLGMQRAHLYKAARARARARGRRKAVWRTRVTSLSERRYIYATRPLPLLPLPYSRRPRCGAPAWLPT